MTVPAASAPLFRRVLLALKELAPYAAVELILPGGSLVALILWLHARRRARSSSRVDDRFPLARFDYSLECAQIRGRVSAVDSAVVE
jgi:hypothetical protein